MNKVEQLKQLLAELPYPVLLDVVDCINWCKDESAYYWVQDGDMYSSEIREGSIAWEGYTVGNGDSNCGPWVTYLFDNAKKMSFDVFDETFGDYW